MKRFLVQTLSVLMVVALLVTSAPLNGFVGLELPSLNFGSLKASAADTVISGSCGANLTYVLDSDGVLTISGTGPMTNWTSDSSVPWYSQSSLIISVIISNGVESIGMRAFYSYKNLTSVTIPEGVTSIGDYAFRGCRSLSSVTIPEGVISIGYSAFYGCTSLADVTIPESMTSIAYDAFRSCSSLTSVSIPESVTSIGSYAFYDCINLKDVYYQCDISSWLGISFDNSSSNPCYYGANLYFSGELVKVVTIPEGVTRISSYTFFGCTSLASIIIPEGVTSIGHWAFNGCSSLTIVTIPDSVKSIGDFAFSDCTSLTSVTIPEGVTSIGDDAFSGCSSLTSVTIPEGVTSIGKDAFANTAYYKKSSNWTGNVLYIGKHLIEAKTSISGSYSIKDGTRSIADYAFWYCTSLTSVTIPESVTSIGRVAFCGCGRLKKAYYQGDILNWFGISFDSYSSNPCCSGANLYFNGELVEDVTIPFGVTSIGNYAYYGCSSLTSITIPDSVKSIGEDAFSDCTSLTSVTIPEGVTSIGDNAFSGCTSLTSVAIPEGVTSIGDNAFSGCTSLTSVSILEGVTSIGNGAFYNCTRLTSIAIPEGVTNIGNFALKNCTSLTSVTIPEGVTSIGEDAFANTAYYNKSSNWTVNVLYIGKHLIKAKTSISGFYLIKADTRSIADNAFLGCSSLTSITISECVTSIGNFAFYSCANLTSITIPAGMTTIGDSAFSGFSSLKYVYFRGDISDWLGISFADKDSTPCFIGANLYFKGELVEGVTIPLGVTSIGNYAFYGCTSLTSITIPDSVKSIGDFAFSDCTSLTSVTITEGVTSIGDDAFSGCSSLTSVTIPEGVTSIGEDAFANTAYYKKNSNWTGNVLYIGKHLIEAKTSISGSYSIKDGTRSIADCAFWYCTSLTSVTIPESVTSIGKVAFYDCGRLKDVYYHGYISNWFGISFAHSYSNPCYSGANLYFNGELVEAVTIPFGVTSIGNYAFYGCSSLTSVAISESVTSIGEEAFYGCGNLKDVYYHGNISGWLGISFANAFSNPCYSEANLYFNSELVEAVTIPSGVTNIGNFAFYGCSSLKSVTIPESVTSIGEDAFHGCDSLKDVYYQGILSDWLGISFANASSNPCYSRANLYFNGELVEAVTIPSGVTSIGGYAFYGCRSLTSVFMPEDVINIGDSAFNSCTKLNIITVLNSDCIIYDSASTLPSTAEILCYSDSGAESYAQKYNRIFFKINDSEYHLATETDEIIQDALGIVYAFNNENMTAAVSGYVLDDKNAVNITVNIPQYVIYENAMYTVVSVADKAFSNEYYKIVSEISTITLPETLRSIGEYAFNNCGMREIIIPDFVKEIGVSAFENCTRLRKISVGKAVTSIGKDAFKGCSLLQWILFSGNYSCDGSYNYSTQMFSYGSEATIYYKSSASGWNLVKSWLYDSGFITNTTGSMKVYAHGEYVYLDSDKLDYQGLNYTLNNTDGTACVSDFTGSDIEIIIPAKVWTDNREYIVTSVASNAFSDCATLKSVVVPSTVTLVGSNAFSGCTALEYVFLRGTMNNNIDNIFDSDSATAIVYITGKEVNYSGTKYACTELSSSLTDAQGITYSFEGETAIVGEKSTTAFNEANDSNTSGYTGANNGEVTIPEFVSLGGSFYKVTGLDRYAFYKCNKLKLIKINKFIGQNETPEAPGIWDCSLRETANLETITVDSGNTQYAAVDGILYSDTYSETIDGIEYHGRLVRVPQKLGFSGTYTMRDNVEIIEAYAFSGNKRLSSIELNDVDIVGAHAFESCTAINSVDFGAVLNIDEFAFNGCSGIDSLTFADGLEIIGTGAFNNCSSISEVSIPASVTSIGEYTENENGVSLYSAFSGCTGVERFTVAEGNLGFCSDNTGVLYKKLDGDRLGLIQYPAACNEKEYSPESDDNLFDNISVISPFAFKDAVNLTSAVLPQALETIGANAFDGCTSLESVTLGKNVSVIRSEVFRNCTALTEIIVDDENSSYFDSDGVLFMGDNDSASLAVYPAGMQRISYTVPSNVTRINEYAFAFNSHLVRVLFGNETPDIGYRAFFFCYGLKEALFSGDIPTAYGAEIFEGTNPDFMIMFKKNTNWQEGTWKPYAKESYTTKEYTAITELENFSVDAEAYLLRVVDTSGNGIEGTEITVDGISNAEYRTGADGTFSFTKPESYNPEEGIQIKASYDEYFPYDNILYLDTEMNVTYITLSKEPTVTGVSCEKTDINSQTAKVNIADYKVGETVDIKVNGFCDMGYYITEYALVQDGVVIDSITPAPTDTDGLDTLHTFETPIKAFLLDKPVQLRMKTIDKEGEEYICANELNIEVFRFDSTDIPPNPLIFEKTKFKIASDIPFLSNSEFEIGISPFETEYQVSGDKINVLYNIDVGELRDLKSSDSFSEYVDKKYEEYCKSIDSGSLNKKSEWKLILTGYEEYLYDKGNITNGQTCLVGKLEWSYKISGTHFVTVIPVYLEAKLSVSGELTWVIHGYDAQSEDAKRVSLEIMGELSSKAGIGCSIASVGVYGRIALVFAFSILPDTYLDEIKLKGEIGAYIHINLFFVSFKKEFPFTPKSWREGITLFKHKNTKVDNSTDGITLSPAQALCASNYAISPPPVGASQDGAQYDSVKPKILTVGGKRIMLYIGDVSGLDTQAVYTAANSKKILYSIYDEENEIWGEPFVVDDVKYDGENGRVDGEFSAYADNGQLFVAYTQAGKQLNSGEAVDDAVSSLDVKTASWNGESFDCMGKIEYVNEDNCYDMLPQITAVNGKPTVVWIKNTDNNIFGISNASYVDNSDVYHTFETTANSIWMSSYSEGSWSTAKCVKDKLPPITSMALNVDGQLAYITDFDCDLTTTNDRELKAIKLDGTNVSTVSEHGEYMGVSTINERLWYSENGNLRNVETKETLFSQEVSNLSEDYQIINDSNGEAKAITYTANVVISKSDGTQTVGSALFGVFCENGVWGSPVQLTNCTSDNYIYSYSADIDDDGNILLASNMVKLTRGEGDDTYRTSYTLNTETLSFADDISLCGVEVEITDNNTVSMNVQIQNNSVKYVDGITVKVYAPSGTTPIYTHEIGTGLYAGQTGTYELEFEVATASAGEYTLEICYATDSDATNNQANFRLVYADLNVLCKQLVLGGENSLIAAVKNSGKLSSNGTLYIMKGVYDPLNGENPDDECLYSMNIGTLNSGAVKYYKIALDADFYDAAESAGVITLYVKGNQPENNDLNDCKNIYINEIKDLGDGKDTPNSNVTMSASSADFDLREPENVSISLELNENTLTGVSKGETALLEQNYSFNSVTSVLSINADYLSTLTEGKHVLTLSFSNGTERTFTINVASSKYTVKWYVDGILTNEDYLSGATPKYRIDGQPVEPFKADDTEKQLSYTFVGWDENGDDEADYYDTLPEVSAAVTYTAIFAEQVTQYKVSWSVGGHDSIESYDYAAKPSYCGITELEGMIFEGWDSDGDGEVDYAIHDTLPAVNGNVSYTAQYLSERLPGDANGDNEVNLKDVVLIRRWLAGGWNVDIDESSSDVNDDNKVDLKDVVLLRRYLAGGWDVVLA